MKTRLDFTISPQPTDTTCGPSCLHAVYRYFGFQVPLARLITEVDTLEQGGTLAVFLGCHALKNGFSARMYTYNLRVFDPTWFTDPSHRIPDKLREQMRHKTSPKLRKATQGYLSFLQSGGEIRFEDLTTALIRKYLNRGIPIITGLSSTYLYRSCREVGHEGRDDDVRGEPAGHFVVLHGYDREERTVMIADPFGQATAVDKHHYAVNIDRVVCSILLGVLTYDANLLILKPRKEPPGGH